MGDIKSRRAARAMRERRTRYFSFLFRVDNTEL